MDRRLQEMAYDSGLFRSAYPDPVSDADIDRWWGEPNEPMEAAKADIAALVKQTQDAARLILSKYDHDLTPEDAGGIADGINDAAHAMLCALEKL